MVQPFLLKFPNQTDKQNPLTRPTGRYLVLLVPVYVYFLEDFGSTIYVYGLNRIGRAQVAGMGFCVS